MFLATLTNMKFYKNKILKLLSNCRRLKISMTGLILFILASTVNIFTHNVHNFFYCSMAYASNWNI